MTNSNDLAAVILTRWEPCVTFAGDASGASICPDCGWLEHEHPIEAEVHTLPDRTRGARRPTQLAS